MPSQVKGLHLLSLHVTANLGGRLIALSFCDLQLPVSSERGGQVCGKGMFRTFLGIVNAYVKTVPADLSFKLKAAGHVPVFRSLGGIQAELIVNRHLRSFCELCLAREGLHREQKAVLSPGWEMHMAQLAEAYHISNICLQSF